MALADRFDGFLIDLDGVVWQGPEFLPGAIDALNALKTSKEIVFVTNNSVRTPEKYAERLRGVGIEVADERIVTGGVATAHLAAERMREGGSAFVIGAPDFKAAVAGAGLKVLDGKTGMRADAVVASGHREFDYGELLTATRALQAGAALFGTSHDPTLPMPGGALPGTGAVLAAIETASGKKAEIGGKPEPHLFEQARALIAEAERVAMVGDRISSDIEGGRRAGLATILVLSGATTREEAERAAPRPDHVVADLAGLLT